MSWCCQCLPWCLPCHTSLTSCNSAWGLCLPPESVLLKHKAARGAGEFKVFLCSPPLVAFSQQTDGNWCINTPTQSLTEDNLRFVLHTVSYSFPAGLRSSDPTWKIPDNTSCVALSPFLVSLPHSIASVSWDPPLPNNLLHSNSNPRFQLQATQTTKNIHAMTWNHYTNFAQECMKQETLKENISKW